MKLWVPGGDERMRVLADMAQAHFGEMPPEEYDTVVLPLPDSTDMGLRLADSIQKGSTVIIGRAGEALVRIAQARNWRLLTPQEDALYTRDNAIVSAEGAIFFAMCSVPFALRGATICVLGFGRIGGELVRLLACMGADVRVCARRSISAPIPYYPMTDITLALQGVQIVFGTIPAPVLDERALGALPEGALVLDLASPPYCVDLAAAQKLSVNARREGGIPGRYAPKTAAKILLTYIERSVRA